MCFSFRSDWSIEIKAEKQSVRLIHPCFFVSSSVVQFTSGWESRNTLGAVGHAFGASSVGDVEESKSRYASDQTKPREIRWN